MQPQPKQAGIKVVNEATLVCNPGELHGEDLERSVEYRAMRAHLHARERFFNWKEGRPVDPEIEFWRTNDTPQ